MTRSPGELIGLSQDVKGCIMSLKSDVEEIKTNYARRTDLNGLAQESSVNAVKTVVDAILSVVNGIVGAIVDAITALLNSLLGNNPDEQLTEVIRLLNLVLGIQSTHGNILSVIRSKADQILNKLDQLFSRLPSFDQEQIIKRINDFTGSKAEEIKGAITAATAGVRPLLLKLDAAMLVVLAGVAGIIKTLAVISKGIISLSTTITGALRLISASLAQILRAIRNIKTEKVQVTTERPIIKTEKVEVKTEKPVIKTEKVELTTVSVDLSDLEDKLDELLDKGDPVLALPEHYGLAPGAGRPCLVIIYKSKNGEKWGQSTFSTSVYHPSTATIAAFNTLSIPNKIQGTYFAHLNLNDGSSIKCSLSNYQAALNYLNFLVGLINPSFLPANWQNRIITGQNSQISTIELFPRKLEYYPAGKRANVNPAQVRYFD